MEITMIGAYMGMILVLAAFVFETRGLLSSRSLLYLYSMGIGETMLTIRAGGYWGMAICNTGRHLGSICHILGTQTYRGRGREPVGLKPSHFENAA